MIPNRLDGITISNYLSPGKFWKISENKFVSIFVVCTTAHSSGVSKIKLMYGFSNTSFIEDNFWIDMSNEIVFNSILSPSPPALKKKVGNLGLVGSNAALPQWVRPYNPQMLGCTAIAILPEESDSVFSLVVGESDIGGSGNESALYTHLNPSVKRVN